MASTLHIDVARQGGAIVLNVRGEVDLATAPILDKQISAAEAENVAEIIVDLDRVTFMDSSGLQVLLAHILAAQNGNRIRLTRGSPQVTRLFTVSGMLDQLPFISHE
jgi:anti-sigma B factor antagonist